MGITDYLNELSAVATLAVIPLLMSAKTTSEYGPTILAVVCSDECLMSA